MDWEGLQVSTLVFAFFPVALRDRTGGTENYKSAVLRRRIVDMFLYTLASFFLLLFDCFTIHDALELPRHDKPSRMRVDW
jgi:hypothetical protein